MVLTMIPSRSIALSAKLRLPSIKFRYGSNKTSATPHSAAPAASQAAPQQPSTGSIYDFQLPARFKRRPIDEEEIEYINRGGPA